MTQHNNWKDEFDKEFPNEEGLYNTESGWCLKADPKRLKSFIDTLLIKRTKECINQIKRLQDSDHFIVVENSMDIFGGERIKSYKKGYHRACEDMATQITKLIETEE